MTQPRTQTNLQPQPLPVLNPISEALLTWHPSPVSAVAGRQLRPHAVRDGETLRASLLRAGIDPHALIVVSVDGELIEVERWDRQTLKPGQIVAAQVSVAKGGGGGSSPLKIILSIGLMIVAPYLGKMANLALFSADSGLAFVASNAVLGGVISIAGNALIGAMFQPSRPDLSSASGRFSDTASSPTYALTGGSNRLRPYEPLPIVMGTHRIFPDYGAKPYTEYEGEDQYLYQIFNFGLSRASFDDFKIGETPISDYQDVEFFWSDAAGNLPNFPGNVDTSAGAPVTSAGGAVVRTSSANAYELAVDIEASLYSIGDQGVAGASCAVAIEYRAVGGSEWIAFALYEVVSYGTHYWSLGVYSYNDYGYGGWVQHSYGGTGYGEHYEGEPFYVPGEWTPDGTVGGYSGAWRWRPYSEILTAGNGSALYEPAPPQPRSITYTPNVTLINGSAKPLRRTFRRAVDIGQYEVRVTKSTADSGSDRLKNDISWSALRTYQTDSASYLGQTRLAVKIRASGQLNGTLQQLSATGTASCLVWDGATWLPSTSRNPAWWFLNFAFGRYDVNGRRLYGCGLAESGIDIDAIKAWATFCTAEGLTFDAIIDRPQNCSDVLHMIARCGLASPSWGSGKLGVVWDARNQPVSAVFSMSNILRGTFSVEYITERLADEIICTFVNPDKGWQQDQVRVLAPGVTTPERPTTIELMGCTAAAMAGKFANGVAAGQVYRRRRVTWESDFEGFVSSRGDVVLLSHDLAQWGYSGRVVAVDGAEVTLERSVPRTGAAEYLALVEPDGTLTIYDVVAGVADTEDDVLTLTEAPSLQSGHLLVDHRWLFSPLPTPGKKVKIVSVQPVSTSRVRIVATDEVPEYYTAWNGTYGTVAPSTLLRDSTPAISALTLNESLARVGSQIVNRLLVDWTSSGGTERVKIRWRIDGGAWTWLPEVQGVSGTSIDIPDLGLVEVEATPVGGVRVGQPVSAVLQVYGKTLPPGDVPWFSISGDVLTWGAVADVDLAGYVIRWQQGNSRSWGDASALHSGLLVASPHTMSWRPSGPVSLLIKAVDTTGNESRFAAAIVTDLGEPLVANVIETHDFHALGFPGEITGGTVEGGTGDLIADADASPMMWSNDLAGMWAVDETTPMWVAATYGAMQYASEIYEVASADAGAQMTLPNTVAAGSSAIDYRRDGTAAMWSTESDPLWADGADPMWSLESWRPWPGAIAAEAVGYEFRVSTNASSTRGRISELAVQLDVPDIVEHLDDIVIASGGTRLPISETYRFIKNVSLTLQDDGGSAESVKVMDKNASLGPLSQCFNSAGSGTAGKIDATIQGY